MSQLDHEASPRPSTTPAIVDRTTWQRERDVLLAREKAHTREGDAIAAARRRLPMTEVPNVGLVGEHGPTHLVDLFEGRDQLVVYTHMFHAGKPIEDQCEGCTLSQWNFQDATYLNAQGVSYAVVCEGPWEEVEPFRRFMGYTQPWFSSHGVDPGVFDGDFGRIVCFFRDGERVFLTYGSTGRGVEAIIGSLKLLDMTIYGRQEVWEDSPHGWPQRPTYSFWRRDGRPSAQWTRPGATPVDAPDQNCH